MAKIYAVTFDPTQGKRTFNESMLDSLCGNYKIITHAPNRSQILIEQKDNAIETAEIMRQFGFLNVKYIPAGNGNLN